MWFNIQYDIVNIVHFNYTQSNLTSFSRHSDLLAENRDIMPIPYLSSPLGVGRGQCDSRDTDQFWKNYNDEAGGQRIILSLFAYNEQEDWQSSKELNLNSSVSSQPATAIYYYIRLCGFDSTIRLIHDPR